MFLNRIFGRFNAYLNRKKGIKLYREKKYEESLKFFNKAINFKSTPELLNYKGYLLEKLEIFDKSLKTYNESLVLEPNNKRVIASKARLLELIGEYGDALNCYCDLFKLGCNDLFVYSKIGFLFKKSGNFSKAIKYFDKGLKLDSNDVWFLNEKSECYFILKDYKKALNIVNKAYDLEPNNLTTLYNMGILLFESHREKEALKFFKKALELDIENPILYSEIGKTYATLNNEEKASKYFKKALFYINNELNKNDNRCDLLVEKSISLFYLGKRDEALDVINKVLKMDPNYLNGIAYKAYYLKEMEEYEKSLFYYDKLLDLYNDEKFIKLREEVLSLLENNKKN